MPSRFPSIWNLPANPLFRRHAVARLRPLPLVVWILVTQTLAGFGWALGFLVTIRLQSGNRFALDFTSPEFRGLLDNHGLEAALIGWLVVLAFQWIILFFKGTFSVATGVARETSEGMMEAQRFTPLPTGHKVVGQLMGLPIQEIVVAALLTLWVIPTVLLGGVPLVLFLKLYLIVATSAVLHHAIGLVAGTIIRQKILAGTLSQVLVVVLNFGLPMAGYFGIGAISHLGARRAFTELLQSHLHARSAFELEETAILWFGHPLSAAFYTWVLTVASLGLLITIIHRRWNHEGSQLLGKPGTLLAAAALLLISWGEFDGFAPSNIIGGEQVSVRIETSGVSALHDDREVIIWIGGFATILGMLNLLAATLLAPSPEHRAFYRHSARPRPWHDGAPAIPWLVAICLLASATFHGVTRPIQASAGLGAMSLASIWWLTAALTIPACCWLMVIVRFGWRGAVLLGFVFGILPVLSAALIVLTTADPVTLARWIGPCSALALPAYGWLTSLATEEGIFPLMRIPFGLALLGHAGLLAWLAWPPHRNPLSGHLRTRFRRNTQTNHGI